MNKSETIKRSSGRRPVRGYVLAVGVVLAAGLGAAFLARWLDARTAVQAGLAAGALAAAGGSLPWLIPLRRSLFRPGSSFLGFLVASIFSRMVFYGLLLAVAARTGRVHLPSFILSLFGAHLAYQIVEIVLVVKARKSSAARPSRKMQRAPALALAAVLAFTLPAATQAAGARHGEHAVAGQAGEHAGQEQVGEAGEPEDAEFSVIHHIVDGHEMETPFGTLHLPQGWMVAGIDMAPTKHVIWMWIASGILLIVLFLAERSSGLVSHGLGNAVESVVVFIRDDIAGKNIPNRADQFTSYLCTLFFFILFCNLVGLVPLGASATSNLNLTAVLAVFSLVLIQAAGIRQNGLVAHIKALCPIPHGVPGWLLPLYVPIIIVVEVVSIFAKPVALALRLFANMTAGHVVIISLIGLIFILKTMVVVPFSLAFALFIECLEIFVALVQAYIFTMLTALFIGLSQHPAH
ncbi:MAG: F0F1 ATP synthase subunit A [Acidobacteriota bacterium]